MFGPDCLFVGQCQPGYLKNNEHICINLGDGADVMEHSPILCDTPAHIRISHLHYFIKSSNIIF